MWGAPAHGEGPGGPWRGHTGPRSASRLPPRGTCPICVPHPGWDTRGLLGGCRIWPPVPAALYYQGNFGFHGRDESAAGHQNPKQPGAPASPGCARRVGGVPIRGLFIYFNAINVYFPPPRSAEAPGVCRTQRGAGVPGQRVGALPGRVWPAGDGEGGIRSRSLPLADGSRARRFPGPAAAAAPGQAARGEGGCTPCPPRFLRRRRGPRRLLFVSGAERSALPAAAPSRRELGTSRSLVPRGPDPSILLLLLPTRRRKAWGCAPCRGLGLLTGGAVGRAETRGDGCSGGNPKASPGAGAGTRKRRSLAAPALPGLKISWRC